jgi:hypothetical protein
MTANGTSDGSHSISDSHGSRDDRTADSAPSGLPRRTLLGTGAALTTFGIAGCLGGGGDDEDSSEAEGDDATQGTGKDGNESESDDGWGEEQDSEGDGEGGSAARAGEYTGPHDLPFEDPVKSGSHGPLHPDSDLGNIKWDNFKSWRMPAQPEAQKANDVDPTQLGEAPGKELYANPMRYLRNEVTPTDFIYEVNSPASRVQVEVHQETRYETGSVAVYESSDGGENWTELELKEDVYDPEREGTDTWKSSLYTAEGLSDGATFVRIELTEAKNEWNPEIGWVGIE